VLCIVHCVGGNRSCFLFFFVAELQPQPTLYKSSVTSNAACPDLLICSVYIQANSGGISQTSVLATAMNGALIVPSTVNTVRTSTCLSYANPYSTNPSVVWNSTYIKGTFLGSFAQGTPAFVTFNVAISGLGDGLNSVKLQVTGYDVNFFQGTQTFCCGACCPSGCATQSQTLSFTSSAPTSAMVGGATYSVAAISTSGLSVVVTVGSSSTSVCSLSGGIVSFQAAGTCTLNANQAGNANYNSATQVQQTFLVGKGLQSISFTSSAPAAIVSGPGYTATAASSAGLPVTLTVCQHERNESRRAEKANPERWKRRKEESGDLKVAAFSRMRRVEEMKESEF
jgi:hypothetical protein